MAKKQKPKICEIPGLIAATMTLQRVRLYFDHRAKFSDGRRWAMSCPSLWSQSVHIDDDAVRKILDAVLVVAKKKKARSLPDSWNQRYLVPNVMSSVFGHEDLIPDTLFDEVVTPWMKENGLEEWG